MEVKFVLRVRAKFAFQFLFNLRHQLCQPLHFKEECFK